MQKKRIIVLIESEKDSRLERFSEECKKKSLEIIPLNIYSSEIMNDKIMSNGKIFSLDKTDVIWAFSNSAINHYLANIAKIKNVFIWPNIESSLFSDKFYTNCFFSLNNIPTPKTILLNSTDINQKSSFVGGYPAIIKKNVGSRGNYVELVKNSKQALKFIQEITQKRISKNVPINRISFLLQEYIKESSGCDYRVLCFQDEIIGIIKRKSKTGFKSNISLGGTAKTIKTNEALETLSKKIMKNGNLFFAGIDFIKSNRGYLAIEINTSAQFKGFEQATGINVAEKIIEKLISIKS